jgi:hypothetical protein
MVSSNVLGVSSIVLTTPSKNVPVSLQQQGSLTVTLPSFDPHFGVEPTTAASTKPCPYTSHHRVKPCHLIGASDLLLFTVQVY